MTSNIVVFQPPDTKDVSITKTEREILYEKFEKHASIPAYHFRSFMEMEDFQKYNEMIKTTIPSIMIKKILPYCTPIIKELPDFSVKTKTVDIFKQKEAEKRKEIYYNISLQLDNIIRCQVEGIKTIKSVVIPANTMFFIIGLEIPQKFLYYIDYSMPNFILSLKSNELLSSGKYGLSEFQSKTWTQSHFPILRPQGSQSEKIYFKSDDDARSKIMHILNYIMYINSFYEKNFYMINNYLYQPPFANYIKKYVNDYNIFYPEYVKKSKSVSITPSIKLMEQLIHGKASGDQYSDDFLFSIFDVFDVYNKINILGINNPRSKKVIQMIDMKNKYNKILIDYNKLKFKKKLEYAKKKSISLNKFNISNLNDLTPTQTKIINLEYEKMEKYYSSFQKHSDDFKVVNSLFWAIANDRQKLIQDRLKEVYKLVKIPKNLADATQMLENKNKIHLICPHVIAKAQKMLETYKTDLIKSGKIREYLINTFSQPPTADGHFCRICGELIADADIEEASKYIFGKRVSFVVEIDPLKQQIWKDVAQIMTSYVKFKDSVNIKPIVNLMTDTLRPELGSIEANLIKIKSNTKDSIKHLMSIYTSIYTFAMVVHMINNNYGKITFSIRPGSKGGGGKKRKERKRRKKHKTKSPLIDSDGETELSEFKSPILDGESNTESMGYMGGKPDPKGQARIQNIINNALYLVLKTKNIAINNVTSISSDSIKPILIKAYKWAATLKNTDTSSLSKDTGKDRSKEDQMKYNNHIYHYLEYAHFMYEFYKNPNAIKKTPSIKIILGRDWHIIENGFKENESVYKTAVIPDAWNTKIGNVELSKYKYESFKDIMEYVKLQLYNQNAVPLSSDIKEHIEKYSFLKTMEYKFYDTQKIKRLRPYTMIQLHENLEITMNDFRPSKIHIEKYYDNNGKPHKFDIYVFQHANNKGVLSGSKKEYTKKDVLGWIKSKDMKKTDEFRYMFIVDERCSVCNTLLSQVKNNNINKVLERTDNIKAFFLYYENRCPKGELHDFIINGDPKKENYCKKCNITKKIVDNKDKRYYDKYNKIYEKVQAEKIQAEKDDIKELSNNKVGKIEMKKFPLWKINNASILELSRTFKIKYNILINLGLSTGIRYKYIESEKINPSSSIMPEQINVRNLHLHGYYLDVIRKYYLIKHYDVIAHLPYDLKQIMTKNKIRDLNKKLPELDQNVLLQYNYYKIYETPSSISNFLLHSISNIILNIFKLLKKAQVNVAQDLIMYIINSLIKSEKMISEPDMSKVAIPGAKDTGLNNYNLLEMSEGDDDAIEGYASPAESVGELADMKDADPDDEFATGELDMERDAEENFEMHHDKF